jgi:hypothetical protein
MLLARRTLTAGPGVVLLIFLSAGLSARSEDDPAATILPLEAQFWAAYNACDVETQRRLFADDVEFYHDKGGATFGADALTDTIRKNLCSASQSVRREAVEGTIRVFPMHRDGVIYGAIVSGEHRFYVREGAEPETWTGIAKFTTLWLLKEGTWKMARVLSYDHRPPPYVSTRKATSLPDAILDTLSGDYRTGQGLGTVRRENGTLVLSFSTGGQFTLHPESDTLFFTQDRDLTFEFTRRADGTRIMRVREKGVVVDEGVADK